MNKSVYRACWMALGLPLVTIMGTPAAAVAQTGRAVLADTVVTATRIEQPVTDIVAEVTLLDRDDIQRSGATTVTQLLANQAGLQTVGFGDASRVFIRGADARMTALYVDGVRVDSQDGVTMLGGGAPWDLISLAQIERIEIVRGPASAVYGSDAMGGVVQIFTVAGEEGAPAPYVDLGLGSHRTSSLRAGISGGHQAWSYALGVSYEDSAGYDTRPDLVHRPKTEAFNHRAANVRLGYQASASHKWELSALDSQRNSSYVPWGGGNDYSAHGSLSATALGWKAEWSDRHRTHLTVTRSVVAKRDDVPFDYETVKQGVVLENTLKNVAGGTVALVLEQKVDAFDSKPSGFGDPAFAGNRTQNGLSLGFGTQRGAHALQANVRTDDDSLYGARSTGALAYAYQFAPGWRSSFSAGTAFKSPTLEQVFGPYGSTQLAPETNRNSEVGLRYGGAQGDLQLTVFRNTIRNMVSSSATLTTCSAGFFCYFNVGQAHINGVTLSGQYRFDGLVFKGSFDRLDPRNAVTGRVLSLRARQVLNAGLSGQLDGWNLSAELQAVGQRFDDAANTRRLAGYGLLHLGASRSLGRDWALQVRLNNVANRQYQEVGDYATPGRTLLATLKWLPKN